MRPCCCPGKARATQATSQRPPLQGCLAAHPLWQGWARCKLLPHWVHGPFACSPCSQKPLGQSSHHPHHHNTAVAHTGVCCSTHSRHTNGPTLHLGWLCSRRTIPYTKSGSTLFPRETLGAKFLEWVGGMTSKLNQNFLSDFSFCTAEPRVTELLNPCDLMPRHSFGNNSALFLAIRSWLHAQERCAAMLF